MFPQCSLEGVGGDVLILYIIYKGSFEGCRGDVSTVFFEGCGGRWTDLYTRVL